MPGPPDPRIQRVLTAVARGVLGEGYRAEVVPRMAAKLEDFPPANRRRLRTTIAALDTRSGSLAFTGRPVPVSWRSAAEVESLLQSWRRSRVLQKRILARALIGLSTLSLYGFEPEEWKRIGYEGPISEQRAEPGTLQPITVDHSQELTCDVVVVGSGAGGGVVAGRLAEAGLDVVVLEKGRYFPEESYHHREPQATSELYLYGAMLATTDLGVQIIAGSTVGGGTMVNYATSFHTPDFVLKEWAELTGIDAFVSGEFVESLDAMATRVGVNTDEVKPGCRDEVMERGLVKLGWHSEVLPRGTQGCAQDDECGYCGFGCRIRAKRGTNVTYLEDATAHGARLVVGADVRKVLIRDGRAVGVAALAGGHRLNVRARAVVAAGGSIETPALLLRSGLRGQVGRHLRLHPGVAAFAVFEEPVRMWTGTLQSRYSAELRDRDGGYGPIFETVPVHPGLGSGAMPWMSAKQHRELMGKFDHIGFVAVLPRDRTAGRVTIARDGTPRVRYDLQEDDERRMIDGLVAAAKVMEAAGATEMFSTHANPISCTPGVGRGVDGWADELRRTGIRGKLGGVSYHQMGSCRMGTDPSRFAIGPDNESHEVRDLFVADASAFPTASGVNPM
ncbi:MAG TPA: GMC family oxidoreductase, partial [Actinomycetota bacterium]|nr:GMC family oxidoreductase [Actinomycetota bacterium]